MIKTSLLSLIINFFIKIKNIILHSYSILFNIETLFNEKFRPYVFLKVIAYLFKRNIAFSHKTFALICFSNLNIHNQL